MLRRVLSVVFGVIFCLFVAVVSLALRRADHTPPVITYGDAEIVYVQGKSSDWDVLIDVTATDDKDGKVPVIVERIVPFPDRNQAQVTYAAKDSANNVSKVNRTIQYSKNAE